MSHQSLEKLNPWVAIVIVALVAFVVLNAQVTVTRLLAYRFFYHFVFFVISMAQLGLAGAGAWLYASRRVTWQSRHIVAWATGMALFSLGALAAYAWLSPEPNLSAGKVDGPVAYAYLVVVSLFLVALNLCGGLILSSLFTAQRQRIGLLYGSDLVGAAVGCLAAVGLMKFLGPLQGMLVSGIGAALAAVICQSGAGVREGRRRVLTAPVFLLLALTALLPFAPSLFDPNVRLPAFDQGIVRHEWNHIARVDAVKPGAYVIDGDASTSLGHMSEPGNAPEYGLVKSEPDVAIVGVGAGPQLKVALEQGAASVLANDINPTILGWDQLEDRETNDGIFLRPEVTVAQGEGRHVLRSSPARFDLIVMHAIDTWTASAQGAYSLSENFLYTREAFADFLDALEPGGVMSVRRWLFWPPRENMRLFTTVLAALEDVGFEEPERHVVVLAPTPDYRRDDLKVWGYLLFSNSPFERDRLQFLDRFVQRKDWAWLYRPDESLDTPFQAYVNDPPGFAGDFPYRVNPSSDANPFFFQYALPWASYFDERLSEVIYSQSTYVLLLCTLVSIVLSLLLLGIPLWIRRRERAGDLQRRASTVYFACLGVGFMAVELPVIQVMTLFLGHPTYALSVVLMGLLAAAGAGSMIMGRLPSRFGNHAIVLASAVALISALALLPAVHQLIHLAPWLRVTLTLLFLLVVGLVLGMPFVAGVRVLGAGTHKVPWAWAINGAAGVVGSCLVMVLMIFAGSRVTLLLAAVCYLLAFPARQRLAATMGR